MINKRVVKLEDGIENFHLGCLVKRLVHPKTTGSKNVGLSIAIVLPEKEIKNHSHNFEEAYFIVEGKAKMRIDDDEFIVSAWESVYIPPYTEHWTKNIGKSRLVIVCALSPPP